MAIYAMTIALTLGERKPGTVIYWGMMTMEYVQLIFEGGPKNSPRRITQVPFIHGKNPEGYESVARTMLQEFDAVCYIPAFNYTHDQYELERELTMSNYNPLTIDDIQPRNYALWCEDGDGHAFSAKDDDKATITVKGDTKLICGPHLNARFTPKAVLENGTS